jgi:hypothetical protein
VRDTTDAPSGWVNVNVSFSEYIHELLLRARALPQHYGGVGSVTGAVAAHQSWYDLGGGARQPFDVIASQDLRASRFDARSEDQGGAPVLLPLNSSFTLVVLRHPEQRA